MHLPSSQESNNMIDKDYVGLTKKVVHPSVWSALFASCTSQNVRTYPMHPLVAVQSLKEADRHLVCQGRVPLPWLGQLGQLLGQMGQLVGPLSPSSKCLALTSHVRHTTVLKSRLGHKALDCLAARDQGTERLCSSGITEDKTSHQ